MAITAAELKYNFSGGAANANPALSLGGTRSTAILTDNTDNNLFEDISGAEHTAGTVDYRHIYLFNDNDSLTLTTAVAWIQSQTTGAESDIAIGVGTAAVGATDAAIANDGVAPTGVTFGTIAVSRATGTALGDITSNSWKGLWIRRTITAGTVPQSADTCSVEFGGDSL